MTPPASPAAVPAPSSAPSYASRVLGLLAGGAAGDALGYTVEFSSLEQIRAEHGEGGLAHPAQLAAVRAGGTVPVSDDTQMTLFVLDGLLEWIEWANEGSMADPAACVWLSCLRWYRTQAGQVPEGAPEPPSRWLDARPELHVQRAPGDACLSGLAQRDMGLPEKPHNPDAKGCGTVMRSAPYGMVPGLEDEHVVGLARQGAVLTHGHPAAWTAAAAHGLVVSRLMAGHGLVPAVAHALEWLGTVPDDGGTARALSAALELARSAAGSAGRPAPLPTTLPAELGEGWVAEEALALAVYAALATAPARDEGDDGDEGDGAGPAATAEPATHFRAAIALAVNHGGDSDSTASLAGQLLGARYGLDVFPGGEVPRWIGERDVVIEAAERWVAATS
ncbi:ADP-ribosylglycohydrolase family protein [Citricoccus sp. SGAir0253]|uniref:ADP-ribosylglycohydrolase family protein n=1 Tax=Citricoccus sp. SGAir0253 TaxID=2567881 RepID=UPI0010CCF2FD|nr:ADP-ribosylglycohydrolase family protein [Citricoccus sp. SGAir0253]QCU78393.1 ADP-ribosylglycohydrolase family protein [Citricoccus sp. SGAir0253]